MNCITRNTPLEQLPELLSVNEAAAWMGIGRGLAYDLARRGDLRNSSRQPMCRASSLTGCATPAPAC